MVPNMGAEVDAVTPKEKGLGAESTFKLDATLNGAPGKDAEVELLAPNVNGAGAAAGFSELTAGVDKEPPNDIGFDSIAGALCAGAANVEEPELPPNAKGGALVAGKLKDALGSSVFPNDTVLFAGGPKVNGVLTTFVDGVTDGAGNATLVVSFGSVSSGFASLAPPAANEKPDTLKVDAGAGAGTVADVGAEEGAENPAEPKVKLEETFVSADTEVGLVAGRENEKAGLESVVLSVALVADLSGLPAALVLNIDRDEDGNAAEGLKLVGKSSAFFPVTSPSSSSP